MKARYLFQIVLLSAVWGVSFLMMRIAMATFPPLWIAMLRCALGAGLLAAVMLVGGNRLPPRRLLPWLLLVAVLNNAVPFTLFAWGERTVPSNIAAVLNATTPIWALLLSMAVDRAVAGAATIAGVLLSFTGVLMVVISHAGSASVHGASAGVVFGVLIIAAAAICYAVATVVAKKKLRGLDPLGLATTQLSLAALMLLPLAFGSAHPGPMRFGPVAAVAVLGFAGSGIAYLLYYRLLEHVSPTQVVAVTYLLPIWGVFWGSFARESITLTACAGVAVTIAGLVLMNLRTGPARLPVAGQPERA